METRGFNIIINLISNLADNDKVERLFSFNHVVAWSLREAFSKRGVECRLIVDRQLSKEPVPEADHSIIISAVGMTLIRDNEKCRESLISSTRGKTALYLDSDYAEWWKMFDHVFTVVEPKRKQRQYVYAGWGADPSVFYPDQDEKALYLDSLLYGKYGGVYDPLYDIYKKALPLSGLRTYCPVPDYMESLRITWPDIQKTLRKCHFFCDTKLGESGLTRLEAATCGALLVVPKWFYRPRTMDSLECRIWSTQDELLNILSSDVDIKANRKKALKHSWDKVAGRMLKAFASKLG